ncbi:ABC transporter ATP-binding protein [Marinomonas sp.]
MPHSSDTHKGPLGIMLSNLQITYLQGHEAIVDKLSMDVPPGQWTCLLGPSGGGKSTLLKFLAGLLDDQVLWSGELNIYPDSASLKSQVAYMAQQDLLLPWLTVLDNVLLSRKFADTASGKAEHEGVIEQAKILLEQVGLAEHEQQFPQQLSGGMRQRVALARTLMQDKGVILMDEPFSALDAVTRHRLQTLAYELLADKTVILVTHDPLEAIRLAHNMYIFKGRPSRVEALSVPINPPPREYDGECANLQQRIMTLLQSAMKGGLQ